jgi:hypothetical protein
MRRAMIMMGIALSLSSYVGRVRVRVSFARSCCADEVDFFFVRQSGQNVVLLKAQPTISDLRSIFGTLSSFVPPTWIYSDKISFINTAVLS